ncbi:hypothetical protein [Ensifer aridi]|uniref:hypothetical protein n=1 Tax=Ensifer aridi TaxID=1708715 RepID=UPI0003FBB009|nr:hypothetical protein [Ensifer aridi]
MHDWDEARRYNGALQEQIRINEEIAESSKADARPGEAKWVVLFLLAVIFFKPAAEYCIELYNTIAGYLSGIAGVLGF